MRSLVLLLVILVATGATAATPFHLPVPDGWRTETIAFPLDFAPDLDFEGLEELRFAPGMFTAGSEDYWTYAFVWWVDEPEPLQPADLAADLEAYFEGLTMAVAGNKGIDTGEILHEVTLTATDGGMSGIARTFDAFTTLEPVVLNIRVSQSVCPDAERRVVWFALSPQPADHPVWEILRAIGDGFRCAK